MVITEKAKLGPQILLSAATTGLFVIRDRAGVILRGSDGTPSIITLRILAIFILMRMSFPASYGQFLGVIQEVALDKRFVEMNKRSNTFLTAAGIGRIND